MDTWPYLISVTTATTGGSVFFFKPAPLLAKKTSNFEPLKTINLKKKTIVVGDTNFNFENQKNQKFVKMMTEDLRFEQLVTRPTFDRLPNFKPSLIDHVYVSPNLKKSVKVDQKCLGFNDHDMLMISVLNEKDSIEDSLDSV